MAEGTIAPPALEVVELALKHPPKKKAKYMNPIQEINLTSTSTKPGYPACLEPMAKAIGRQIGRDVAPVWGKNPAVSTGTPITPDPSPLAMQNVVPVPGAAGFHEESNGLARGFVATPADAPVLKGSNADAVTASHEAIEMIINPATNVNVDMPDGTSSTWQEGCDAVENDTYDETLEDGTVVTLSNFVYPAWFDPQAPAGSKFDHLGLLKAPFTMRPGGYMGVRTEPGTVSQVFARAHGSEPKEGSIHHIGMKGGREVHVLFGHDYPEEKKAAKIAKVKARAGLT